MKNSAGSQSRLTRRKNTRDHTPAKGARDGSSKPFSSPPSNRPQTADELRRPAGCGRDRADSIWCATSNRNTYWLKAATPASVPSLHAVRRCGRRSVKSFRDALSYGARTLVANMSDWILMRRAHRTAASADWDCHLLGATHVAPNAHSARSMIDNNPLLKKQKNSAEKCSRA